LEEKVIEIVRALLGGKPDLPARQIFRAVNGNAARIRVLKTLLEKAPINKEKTAIYDEIISEFGAINSIRNKFAHGLDSMISARDLGAYANFSPNELDIHRASSWVVPHDQTPRVPHASWRYGGRFMFWFRIEC
jgi:hypothetical protein